MVLVAFCVRVAVIPFVYDEWITPYNIQHFEPGNVARALLSGHGFGSPIDAIQPSASMPPAFCVVVAFFFAVFGIHTLKAMIAILTFNCLLSALAAIPIRLTAAKLMGRKSGLWAGWVWCFFPYGIYFAAEWAWSTHMLLLEISWLLYLALRLGESARLGDWALFGALGGFAALTEPVALTILPALTLLAAYRLWRSGKPAVSRIVLAAVMTLVVISPWTIRNYFVFHRFIPMRDNMGLELRLGNDGFTHHWVHADTHPNHDAAQMANYERGELQYMDHQMVIAKAYIHQHPGFFAWMSLRRAVYLWTGYWSFEPSYLKEEEMDPPNIFFATSMLTLAIIGLWRLAKTNLAQSIGYAGVLFCFPALYYFSHPQAYHMRPIDPLFVILAVCAIRGAASADVIEVLVAEEDEKELVTV
jgi:4-amino-4-deoxy-L-arabinose transferase-like glycosyltransferase